MSDRRPLLMRVRPFSIRERFYERFYGSGAAGYAGLYEDAPLAFAPKIRLRLRPSDTAHQRIAFTGFYELEETRMMTALAPDCRLLVDVGANYGYYTCLWAGLRPDNEVIAIEPSPGCAAGLRENIARNSLVGRVTVLECAAGDETGKMAFDAGRDGQTGWGGLVKDGPGGAMTDMIEVRVRKLDEIMADAGHDMIDVLKIDTEGADALVIAGAERLFKERKVRHIFFEENVVRMEALGLARGAAQGMLKAFGYRVREIGRSGDRAMLSKWRADRGE